MKLFILPFLTTVSIFSISAFSSNQELEGSSINFSSYSHTGSMENEPSTSNTLKRTRTEQSSSSKEKKRKISHNSQIREYDFYDNNIFFNMSDDVDFFNLIQIPPQISYDPLITSAQNLDDTLYEENSLGQQSLTNIYVEKEKTFENPVNKYFLEEKLYPNINFNTDELMFKTERITTNLTSHEQELRRMLIKGYVKAFPHVEQIMIVAVTNIKKSIFSSILTSIGKNNESLDI
ncbi:MAG: hypothetical protein ACRYGR_00740 [Janthinobacterium lividum]